MIAGIGCSSPQDPELDGQKKMDGWMVRNTSSLHTIIFLQPFFPNISNQYFVTYSVQPIPALAYYLEKRFALKVLTLS